MMKNILYLLAAVVFVFFLVRVVILINGKLKAASRPPGGAPVAVEVAKVSHASLQDIRQFTGTVYPQYQYVVAPKVAGRVIEIVKRIGDPVKKGEMIARIDDAEYQQELIVAEADLKIAQASLTELGSEADLAKQELARVQSLRDKGISSPSELDVSNTNNVAQQSRLKLSEAQVEQRQAALNTARIRLSYTILTAPEPGFVGERFVDEGALLSPNSPVISVVAIDRVIVRTTIVERDYGRIRVGQPATVTVDAFPAGRFEGKVARLAPMIHEEARVAQMEIEVDNPAHMLKPGMFAKVEVVLSKSDSALVVPSEAIVTRHGATEESGVFMIDQTSGSVAKYVPVVTGLVTPDLTEILSPQIDGLVVVLGQHLLNDGSKVILPGQGGGARGRGGRGGRGGESPAPSRGQAR
jgi:RND family efflux transporter MFP subunit